MTLSSNACFHLNHSRMTQYTTASRPRRSFFGLAIAATIIAIIGTLITYLDSNLVRLILINKSVNSSSSNNLNCMQL